MRKAQKALAARRDTVDRPAAPVIVDPSVNWTANQRTGHLHPQVSYQRTQVDPNAMDITGTSQFLHDGDRTYTFLPAHQIHGDIHDEDNVVPDASHQAAGEQIARTRFPSVKFPVHVFIDLKLTNWQDDPMRQWRARADEYLAEVIRLEAPSVAAECPSFPGSQCSSGEAIFRCHNCFDRRLYCWSCFLVKHADLFLHRVEVSRHLDLRDVITV